MIFKAENNLSVISFGGNTLKSCQSRIPLFNLLSQSMGKRSQGFGYIQKLHRKQTGNI